MKQNCVSVFEHSRLPIGGVLTQAHFDQLVRYNEKHGNRFFDVGYRRILFKSYVGVMQVGNLVIEVLPKADASADADKKKWRDALLNMLKECRLIRLRSLTSAHLQLRSASLVDLYFETFLAEVSDLIHQGMVKRYRQEEGSLPVWKGQIRFPEHLRHNLAHQERVFSRYVTYDQDNLFNQILKRGLEVLSGIANPHLAAIARQQLLAFEKVSDVPITMASFRRLRFGRKTERYQVAIQLAQLIILNYSPDLKAGREHLLSPSTGTVGRLAPAGDIRIVF